MSRKLAYLTLDDGPERETVEQIDYLDSRGVKAIWTCGGRLIERFGEKMVYAVRRGHIVGNHGYDHPSFSEIGLEEARAQIEKTDRLIEEVYEEAGVKRPMKIFRFPYLDNGDGEGDYEKMDWSNEHVRALQRILRDLGYRQPRFKDINYEWYRKAGLKGCLNVDCTYDTWDSWLHPLEESEIDLETVLARMDEDLPEHCRGLNYDGSNEIIMMHAFIPLEAFKAVIEKMLGKGLRFVLPEFD
jgi:peptidoglycan/xylan/chitin deacetylase (PgdA/CDA1 family)